MRFIKYGRKHQVTIVWTIINQNNIHVWQFTSDKHIFYNQSRIYYLGLKSKVSIKNKKSIFICNADSIPIICFCRCIHVRQLMHSRSTSMFLDIQHVYLHQPLLIRQIQVCMSSSDDLTNSSVSYIYKNVRHFCWYDNFMHV